MRREFTKTDHYTSSFNPRICKRCDLGGLWDHCIPYSSFNPRICKRCDAKMCRVINIGDVSIHASVKDATCLSDLYLNIDMFQSTHL